MDGKPLSSNPKWQRAFIIFSIVASSIVLVLAVIGILTTWFLNFVLGNAVNDLSLAVENTAQVAQRGVTRVDTRIANLESETQQIVAAAQQLSTNVSDEGLIRTLLPESKTEKIDNALGQLQESMDAVTDTVSSARATYRAMNRIPGVNLPTLPETTTDRITTVSTEIRANVSEVKAGIQRVRDRSANAVDQLVAVGQRVNERLGNLRTQLAETSTRLTNIQNAAIQFRQTMPIILISGALVLTLLQLWVIYTQIVILRLGLARWRSLKSEAAAA